MSYFVPIFSKTSLSANNIQQVYICPSDKSHAYIDLLIYKDQNPGTSLVAIAVTTESDPNNLTSLDFFLDDVELIDSANIATLEKILVGTNERVYVKVISGSDCNIRLTGLEENNTKIQKAGRLAALAVPNTNTNLLFENTYTGIAYINGTVTVYNPSSTNNANIELWISSATTPDVTDKIIKIELTTQDSSLFENITLAPNEKLFVKSDIVNTEFFFNGVIVKS